MMVSTMQSNSETYEAELRSEGFMEDKNDKLVAIIVGCIATLIIILWILYWVWISKKGRLKSPSNQTLREEEEEEADDDVENEAYILRQMPVLPFSSSSSDPSNDHTSTIEVEASERQNVVTDKSNSEHHTTDTLSESEDSEEEIQTMTMQEEVSTYDNSLENSFPSFLSVDSESFLLQLYEQGTRLRRSSTSISFHVDQIRAKLIPSSSEIHSDQAFATNQNTTVNSSIVMDPTRFYTSYETITEAKHVKESVSSYGQEDQHCQNSMDVNSLYDPNCSEEDQPPEQSYWIQ